MRLREEFGMTALGTIQANRKGLPKAITSTEGRPVGDYQVLYDESSNITIHSEICKSKSGTVKLHFILILIGFKNLVPVVIIRIRQMKKKLIISAILGAFKNVLLMTSTAIFSARIMDATAKLYIINFYNYTMGGTDRYQ